MLKREQIYNTALQMFTDDGYSNTPLSRIASAVGLTKGGLFHYFKSKEELLFLLHEQNLKEHLIPILEEAEKIQDPEQRIIFFIKNYTKNMAKDASARVLIHEVGELMPHHRRKVKKVWKRTLDLLRKSSLELQESGRCKPFNKTFVAFAALGMCSWTFYWFDYDRKESAHELADIYAEIFLKGYMSK